MLGLIFAVPAVHASVLFATSPAACASVDGSVGFSCPNGVAETNSDPALSGFGFYINPIFRQFNGGRGNPNGPAPLGDIVDGSHDPSSPDGTSGCAGMTVDQHCETLVFAADATARSIAAGTTMVFSWDNIDLSLQDFGGPNGAYIDQYFVTYIIIQNGNPVVEWSSDPVDFTQTGRGTFSGPRTELDLSGSGSTVLGTTLDGDETVEVGLTIGWVWLGPQTGTPAAAGDQGPGVDLDIGIGKGSLDIGISPEPSSIALSGLGLALVGLAIRRRKLSGR